MLVTSCNKLCPFSQALLAEHFSCSYRCVKTSYTTTGRYDAIWLDRGSGADRDVGIWGNHVSQSNIYGVDANAFTSFATHGTPTGSPRLLDGEQVINHQLYSPPATISQVFNLYEVADFDEIWNDRGSGADRDISIWRSRGGSNAYSLGDIAVPGGRPQRGFVIKAQRNGALISAYDFAEVWKDRGSGADWDVTFYRPLCPVGYRALGHVAVRNHHQKPSAGDFRCVHSQYTLVGGWDWVWNDAGSGADDDVSVWKARPNGKGQGVEAMSTIRHHGHMNVLPYVLNPDVIKYIVGKPPQSYILQNINYHFDDRKLVNSEPENIARTVIVNQGTTEQTSTRELTYQYDESYSWSHSAGLEIGVETTISSGIPLIASSGVSANKVYRFLVLKHPAYYYYYYVNITAQGETVLNASLKK